MAKTPIIHAPHAVLRAVAQPVEQVDAKILELASQLSDTLLATIDPPGVGLAAPQISKKWRLFATNLEDAEGETSLRVFVNPSIIDASSRLTTGPDRKRPDLEGCLSIPLYYGPVERPEWVTCTWQEITSDKQLSDWHTATFYDFDGRVMQHELDHLNGILFTDHILSQGQPLYRVQKDELVEVDPQEARLFQ